MVLHASTRCLVRWLPVDREQTVANVFYRTGGAVFGARARGRVSYIGSIAQRFLDRWFGVSAEIEWGLDGNSSSVE
jgi:hypothetical protein